MWTVGGMRGVSCRSERLNGMADAPPASELRIGPKNKTMLNPPASPPQAGRSNQERLMSR